MSQSLLGFPRLAPSAAAGAVNINLPHVMPPSFVVGTKQSDDPITKYCIILYRTAGGSNKYHCKLANYLRFHLI